jgi:hypothetical protein
VLVVVIPVQRVPVRAVEIVDVILVRDGLMAATVPMGVVVNLGGDVRAYRVFVVVIAVQMVRMAVVEVVDVAVMFDGNVATGRPVVMVVIGMCRVGGHGIASFRVRNPIVACAYVYDKSSPAGAAIFNDNDYQ